MKIGLVCPYSIALGGGVKEHVYAIQTELARRGHEAYIITPRPRDYQEPRKDHVLFVGTATDFKSPLKTTVQLSAAENESIESMITQEQFDILHFHEPWVPVLSRQLLVRSTSVNIATFHANIPKTIMSRTVARVVTPYTKAVLRYVHELTAVSDAAAEYVRTLTDEPITLIPNGIDLTRYQPPRAFADKRPHKTIFYVGRLEARKGVKYLLRAFKLLQAKHPNTTLIIAGDGVDRAKLVNLTHELDLSYHVKFLGFISDEEKLHYLQTSDLFCSPALYGESFGIVLLEAMATGIVTVAGDNPGYTAVLKGLGAISLINPKLSEEFARRLELLLFEPKLRQVWRDWAKKEVPAYSYQKIVDQYEALYKKALKRHAK